MKEVDMTKKIAGASWIKMRTNLWDDPRVSAMCDELDCDEPLVVGGLFYLWSLADEHTVDGIIPSMTLKTLDRKSKILGFGNAVISVGWLREVEGGLEVVKFDEHNGASAKRRMEEAKRKAISRSVSPQGEPGGGEIDSDEENDSESTACDSFMDSVRNLSATCPENGGQNSDTTEDLSATCPEKSGQKSDFCGHIADLEKEKEVEEEKEVKTTTSPVGVSGKPVQGDKPKAYFASTMDLSGLKLPDGVTEESFREFLVGATAEVDTKGVVKFKPMTYSRVNMLLKQLREESQTHDPAKVVNLAVANGWKKLVFDDKTKRSNPTASNVTKFVPAAAALQRNASNIDELSDEEISRRKSEAIARARQQSFV